MSRARTATKAVKKDSPSKPKPSVSMNYIHAKKADMRKDKLEEIVRACNEDGDHIDALHYELQLRLKATESRVKGVDDEEIFPQTPTMNTLDDDFVMQYVLKNSDMTKELCIKTLDHDPKSLVHMVVYDTGTHVGYKLPAELKNLKVATMDFLVEMAKKMASRLSIAPSLLMQQVAL